MRKGVNKPGDRTDLATQMSHRWIIDAIETEKITAEGRSIRNLAEAYDFGEISCPYHRWIVLVTGRQLHKHQKANGADHEIQTLLKLPENILNK